MNDTILINRLPTRTWNRLCVNETALTWGQADDLGEEKITAVKATEAARRAVPFHAMQACSASTPVCAAYRMRNSPVKAPGRNRSLAFSLVGVPWWSL